MTELKLDIAVNFTDFSLTIDKEISLQGITGIFGHSGSGKSTLLRTIAGLNSHAKGAITLNEKTLFSSSNSVFIKAEQRNIGLVFQDSRLFPHLNVKDNLLYAIKRRQSQRLNYEEIIELTGIKKLLNKNIDQLSGGEQQRVALTRALLLEPTLLLLDEPLSALDQHNRVLLLSLITKVQQQLALPILYVSHNLTELQQVAARLLVLEQGKITNFGNIHQVIHHLNHQGSINAQTSLSLKIKEHLPNYGLSSLVLTTDEHHNKEIFLPTKNCYSREDNSAFPIDKTLRCFIAASDISIVKEVPSASSIVNKLSGLITHIDKTDQQNILVTVRCYQQDFFALITLWSFEQLTLKKNDKVYIQFKAGAVRTI